MNQYQRMSLRQSLEIGLEISRKEMEFETKRNKEKLINSGFAEEKVNTLEYRELVLITERLEELKKQKEADKLIAELSE